jgi:pimeloyl-ACP methyl ester carboxylesterase
MDDNKRKAKEVTATDIRGEIIRKPQFITVNGRRIAYDEVSPSNPEGTVLLLTGLGAKRQAWYNQLEVFGKYFRTIAIDNRDAGDSEASKENYSVPDLADDAAGVLQALGVERAHVAGISMGGFISLELTLRHPALVEKLVPVATSAGGLSFAPSNPRIWFSRSWFKMLTRNTEQGELEKRVFAGIMGPGFAERNPQVMENIARIGRYRPQTRDGYLRQVRACLTHNVAGRLKQITAPTLVIHGDKDPLVTLPNGKRIAAKIPNARLLVYPGVGHIPIIERAAQFNQDVLNFLRS